MLSFRKTIQSLKDKDKIIRLLVKYLRDLGYKKILYWDVVDDSQLNEMSMTGRYSVGLRNGAKFLGYQFHGAPKDYLNKLMDSKRPYEIKGRQLLKRKGKEKWIKEFSPKCYAFIDMPLVIGEDIFGIITLFRENDYFPLDNSILGELACVASLAIHNACSHENLNLLTRISSKAMTLQPRRGLLQSVVEQVGRALKAQMCSLFLYDENVDKLVRKETYIRGCKRNDLDDLFEETYRPGANITGYAFKFEESLNITNLKYFCKKSQIEVNWEYICKYQKFFRLKTGRQILVKNAMFAPLTVGNRRIGVIRVVNNLGGVLPFPNYDLDFLEVLSGHIALIIHNAGLFKTKENLERRLRALSDFSDVMLRQFEEKPKAGFKNIVEYAAEIMQTENVSLFVGKKGEYLHLVEEYGNPTGTQNKEIRLKIQAGKRTGLTGYAATLKSPLMLYGDELTDHWAVKNRRRKRAHLKSGECISLLAIPLRKDGRPIGLLKFENRFSMEGSYKRVIPFSSEDAALSEIFADKISLFMDLAERQRFLNRIIDEITEAFVAIDGKRRIWKYNRMAERLMGWKSEEAVGKGINKLFFREVDFRSLMKKLEGTIEQKVDRMATTIKNSRGELVPVLVSAANIADEGGVRSATIMIFRDKREEQRYEWQERMAALGSITTEIAHSIRGILGTLRIVTEGAQQELGEKYVSSKSVNRFSQKVHKATIKGLEVLDRLGQYKSSIEASPKTIGLKKLIKTVLMEFGDVISEKNIKVDIKIKNSIHVVGDPILLAFILRSLIENSLNSIKYLGIIRVSMIRRKDMDDIQIRDSGSGIPASIQSRVFEPFVGSGKQKGSFGMGLFVSKYYAHLMGGDISLLRTGKGGTTFEITLKRNH